MNKETKVTVEMTAEEKARFEAFQKSEAKRAAEEKARADREMYKQMVDNEIDNSIPVLLSISEQIKQSKQKVLENFKTILELKGSILKTVKDDQKSHTFTNSDGSKRITLGVYVTDGYRDTVEDGIAIVKEYIESLAKDEKTKSLVRARSKPRALCSCVRLQKSRAMNVFSRVCVSSKRATSPR